MRSAWSIYILSVYHTVSLSWSCSRVVEINTRSRLLGRKRKEKHTLVKSV